MSIYHIQSNIAGLLRNCTDETLEDLFNMTAKEARKQLQELLDKGHKLLPSTGCKHFDPFEHGCQCRFHENDFDETKPEYYLKHYNDDETYKSVKHDTYDETTFTGEEYRELFMSWYNKIKPFLDTKDEHSVIKILINWKEETLAKFDLYSLVRKYFKK